MTSDGLTKDYGPLEHWRRIQYLLGEQSAITQFQEHINHRYGGRKRILEAIEDVSSTPPTPSSTLIILPTTPITSLTTLPPTPSSVYTQSANSTTQHSILQDTTKPSTIIYNRAHRSRKSQKSKNRSYQRLEDKFNK